VALTNSQSKTPTGLEGLGSAATDLSAILTHTSFFYWSQHAGVQGVCFSLPEFGFVVFIKHFNDMKIATIISDIHVTAFYLYIVTLRSTTVLLLPPH